MTPLEKARGNTIADRIELVRGIVNAADFDARLGDGKDLEDQVSIWQRGDPLSKLVDLLTVATALNSAHSARCIRRVLQQMSAGPLCNKIPEPEQLESIAEVLVTYYSSPQYGDNLTELRDAVYMSVEIPFPQLARIAGRLMVPSKEGAHFVAPDEMASVIFSKKRRTGTSATCLKEGIHQLVNDYSAAVWARMLPEFYFDSRSDRETADGCTTFLQHCFDPSDPALLLVLDHDHQDILARVVDVRHPKSPSREDFMETLKRHGVRGPEAPLQAEDYLADDGNGDFFEIVASARQNARLWIGDHCNTVVPFRRPR